MRRAWLLGLLVTAGCHNSPASLPPAVQAVVDSGERSSWMTKGEDPWEVFICHVPDNSQSPVYAGLLLRAPLTPEHVASILDTQVRAYFEQLSHGAYHPRFTTGGEVTIATTDEPQGCVDKALEAASDGARGVIAVADAEHNANKPGGFANPGSECAIPPCNASTTRRSAYVGAADFSSQWGDRPPMDLIEHEIGHALGWPHSGFDETMAEPERSALDVMSNSAAPRTVHADRRDGPGTLAINLLTAGWLSRSDVTVIPKSGGTVTLSPSGGTTGTRLAVVGLDGHSFITVELLSADGFDDHLPATGVAVHLIEGSGATRRQTPLIGLEPYDDLLREGETFSGNGWQVSVADGWRATIQPIASVPTVGS